MQRKSLVAATTRRTAHASLEQPTTRVTILKMKTNRNCTAFIGKMGTQAQQNKIYTMYKAGMR